MLSCLLFHFALRTARLRECVFLVSTSSSPLFPPPSGVSNRFDELPCGLPEVGVADEEVGVAEVEVGVADRAAKGRA